MSEYDGAHVSTSLASMRSTSRIRSGLVMVIELLVKHQNASSMRRGRVSIESMTTVLPKRPGPGCVKCFALCASASIALVTLSCSMVCWLWKVESWLKDSTVAEASLLPLAKGIWLNASPFSNDR